jgi:AmmeMemoRadiSam system protein B
MRNEAVAGAFYPADKNELREQVLGLLKKAKNIIGAKAEKGKLVGGVVPHAGYIYSGECAANFYKGLKFKGTVVLLGVNHSGYGHSISLSLDDFKTPLGIVKNDKEFSKEIIRNKGSLDLDEDEQAHSYEHSLEVQLPFLQIQLKDFKIVPIVLKDYTYDSCKKLANLIFQTADNLKRKILVIASSDFTHYGRDYGFMPFFRDNKKGICELDGKMIKLIEKMDSENFLKEAGNTTICGQGAIAVAIELAVLLGAKKGKLLKYYTSADKTGKCDSAVGYGCIGFS